MMVSWTGVVGGNITGIQIGGGGTEWTGSQPSGSTLDINNFTIGAPGYSAILDYLTFDRPMSSATIFLDFIMADGSAAHAVISLAPLSITLPPTATPTVTPIVTSTPTPTLVPTSCLISCMNTGYVNGSCRKSCNAGEISWPNGSTFCRSGQLRTCCCY